MVRRSLPFIMTHRNAKIRPAMTAIAAVLAFSSTPLFAQSVDPVVTAPAPAGDVTPAPIATEPLAAKPIVVDTAVDPVAVEAVAKPTARKTTVTETSARSRPAMVRVATAASPVARAPVAVSVAKPAEPVAAASAPLVAIPGARAPVVATAPPAHDAPAASGNVLPIAGAAGLGLLGLIGVGAAMRRRKRRNEEEIAAADQVEPAFEAPTQADPLFAEPAFAPRPEEQASATTAALGSAGSPSDCVDAAPGSHVEAACDGPTADNPSLSIKKRLKRAHFFDQREFLAEAGEVAPMAADAGLPDAVAAPAPPIREPA